MYFVSLEIETKRNRLFELILMFYIVPGAPADIKVAAASVQSLRVSWLPPTDPNGVITKYNLYRYGIHSSSSVTQNRISMKRHNGPSLVFEWANMCGNCLGEAPMDVRRLTTENKSFQATLRLLK